MLLIIDGKAIADEFEVNMTLEKAQKYLKEYKDFIMHPKYYQSIVYKSARPISWLRPIGDSFQLHSTSHVRYTHQASKIPTEE